MLQPPAGEHTRFLAAATFSAFSLSSSAIMETLSECVITMKLNNAGRIAKESSWWPVHCLGNLICCRFLEITNLWESCYLRPPWNRRVCSPEDASQPNGAILLSMRWESILMQPWMCPSMIFQDLFRTPIQVLFPLESKNRKVIAEFYLYLSIGLLNGIRIKHSRGL